MAKKKQKVKVSLKDYAAKHNPRRNRRGHPMSYGYLYRLIRQDIDKKLTVKGGLWFEYQLEGDKDRIWVLI